MAKALDYARWFINQDNAINNDEKISKLKVLKLLYYAEGVSLCLNGISLFSEKIYGWEHGPVVREVYNCFPNPYCLDVSADDMEYSLNQISEDDQEILKIAYNLFGQYSAWKLRNMTHEESPWIKATNNGSMYGNEISKEDIKEYFETHYNDSITREIIDEAHKGENIVGSFATIEEMMESFDV